MGGQEKEIFGVRRRGRPFKVKSVDFDPKATYFKPRSVPLSALDEVVIGYEEAEAIRLSDIEELSQSQSAAKMDVHQSTFQRTLCRARKKIADALCNGKAIKIEGGWIKMPGRNGTGPTGRGPAGPRGAGRGRGRGFGYGGPDVCKCPECGKEVPHQRGRPCVSQKCPDCGASMARGD